MNLSNPVRLLGLSGSLRAESYSTAVLRGLQVSLGPEITLDIRDVCLPLYNQDCEGEATPQEVQAFRDAIDSAEGLVICTPEFNHGIPGVLKNALDWASRPSATSVLKSKPVLGISNSPAFTGGVRAHAQLHETFLATQSDILSGRQVVIGNVPAKIRAGMLADEATLAFASEAVARLAKECRERRVKPQIESGVAR
jgi:chromate reductase